MVKINKEDIFTEVMLGIALFSLAILPITLILVMAVCAKYLFGG